MPKFLDNDSTDRKIELLEENCEQSIYNLQVLIFVMLSREILRLNAWMFINIFCDMCNCQIFVATMSAYSGNFLMWVSSMQFSKQFALPPTKNPPAKKKFQKLFFSI